MRPVRPIGRVCCSIILAGSVALGSVASAADDEKNGARKPVLPAPAEANWYLLLPKEDKVLFRGSLSMDKAGVGAHNMVYPIAAGNIVVSLLAGLVTHGLIVEGSKNAQKSAMQIEADKVLLPYQETLNSYTHRELMQKGLDKISAKVANKKLVDAADKAEADWFIESVPVFTMTQDQSAIVLDNFIAVYGTGKDAKPIYQNTVRIVPKAMTEEDNGAYWSANQSEKLKQQTVALFTESLDVALADIADEKAGATNPQKTFRYLEGKLEKIERGQLVNEKCDRVVMKTLRGDLMVIPPKPSDDGAATACPTIAAGSK